MNDPERKENLVFRYYSLGNEELEERVADLLLRDSIFLSAPAHFNDPFDRPYINFSGSDDDWNLMLDEQINSLRRKSGKKLSPSQKWRLKSQAKRKNRSQTFIDHFNQRTQNDYCALCLSQKRDSLLMWSHYADSHRGICVGFDIDELQSNFEHIFRINYQKKFPEISILDSNQPLKFLSAFNTKHPDWSYEEEIRVVNMHSPRKVKFSAQMIKSVYLGCEISNKTKEYILKLLDSRELKINAYQAEKDLYNLKLRFKALKTP